MSQGVIAALEAMRDALRAAGEAAEDLRAAAADAGWPVELPPVAADLARDPDYDGAGDLLARVADAMCVGMDALRGGGRQRTLTRQRRVAVAVLRMAGHTHAAIGDAIHRDGSRSSIWCADVDADPDLRDAAIRLGHEVGVASEADAAAAQSRQLARGRNRERWRR